MRISGGNALKLTTAKYYTPSGRNINKDEEPNDESAILMPEEAIADSGRVYYTEGGRLVYGGGGIHPDIEIKPDEMPKIASGLARQGLVFEFAVEYVASDGDVPGDFGDDPALMTRFKDFLATNEFEYTDEEFEEGRDFVKIMLRSEIARKVWGDNAAYAVSMEGDSQLRKIIELVQGVNTLSDLFASAAQYSEITEQ
jgi:carboxyl-terminal processing protease